MHCSFQACHKILSFHKSSTMPSAILYNQPASALPPLAFATPAPSPGLIRLRRKERAANEPPPLLKRKRSAPSSRSYNDDLNGSYLPTFTDIPAITTLPYLDCENFGRRCEATRKSCTPSLPLPSITLSPRTKRCRIGCVVSSSPQEEDNHDRKIDEQDTRKQDNCAPSEENNDTIKNSDPSLSNSMRRTSSSKSMLMRTSSSKSILTRRSSMNLTRSLSLQFNMSLMNLAAAATNNDCPISASSSSSIPSNDVQNQDVNKDSNHRRSPVAATLDYLATAIRFPDVGIGLSI